MSQLAPIDVSDMSSRSLSTEDGELTTRLARKYGERITGTFVVPARPGRFAEFPEYLPPQLAAAQYGRG